MKNVSELKFDELTLDQKLGMVHAAMINGNCEEAELEFVFDRIRARALGAVWVQFSHKNAEELIKKVREIADYPILIITDAENGISEYTIGRHNPISCTGDEKYAYAFGKAVGYTDKKWDIMLFAIRLLIYKPTAHLALLVPTNTQSQKWLRPRQKDFMIAAF